MSIRILAISLWLSVAAFGSPDAEKALEESWHVAKRDIYPASLESKFTDVEYRKLMDRATEAADLEAFAPHYRSFLSTLEMSHNEIGTTNDWLYYLFRSQSDIGEPKVFHIGVQSRPGTNGARVHNVLEGYPGERLKRGDVILSANGKPFQMVDSFDSGNSVELQVQRGSKIINLNIEPVLDSPHESLLLAMQQSVKAWKWKQFKFGYVHLWSGTHEKIAERFIEIIDSMNDYDGIVLDLRDGYGGAGYEYLDPFFADRQQYIEMETVDRNGKTVVQKIPPIKKSHQYFKGKLVVLVNEGVRSGKELMAYQLKQSRRAVLIGSRTAGAVTAGRIKVFDDPKFALMFSNLGVRLNGKVLEGVGVAPDILVDWSVDHALPWDPQLLVARTMLQEVTQNDPDKGD